VKIDYSESFAGMGAWGKAIKQVTENHGDICELKWYSEINKYASNSFSAIHEISEELNIWDIAKNAEIDPVDIFFYSPPCQSFSLEGKRGLTNVPKGNLFYDATKLIKKSMPKYAIMENVKGLTTGKSKESFNNMLKYLDELGYVNYWKVLNSKDYNVPQNRNRVYVVSIRKDLDNEGFDFPTKMELNVHLKDIVENDIDEKYYLSEEMANLYIYKESDGEYIEREKDELLVKTATKSGYDILRKGDSIDLVRPNSKTRRGRVGKQVAQTLNASPNIGYYDGDRIRRLTPLEYFRLQGFKDEDYYKAVVSYDETYGLNQDGTTKSGTKMYTRAGNSITVDVIEVILEKLLYK